MTEPMTDAEMAEVRQQHAKWGLSTNPASNVVFDRLFARLDAERTRAEAAEAERDAALARAMPEPRFMATVEDVKAPAPSSREAPMPPDWCETCQSLLDAIAAAREEQVALARRLSDRSTDLRARGDADEGARVGRDAEEHRMAAVAISGLWERCNVIVFGGGPDATV